MLAHIAGAPLEETALGLAPVALVALAMASAYLRRLSADRRVARPRHTTRRKALGRRA
jgi:hypothetical protein